MTIEDDVKTVREVVDWASWHAPRDATGALNRISQALEALQEAHARHLMTGDYMRLGMDAQDIIRPWTG